MAKIEYARDDCPRPGARQVDGVWWCLWHPDQSAPDVDWFSGQLRNPGEATLLVPSRAARSRPGPSSAPARAECPRGCGRLARHPGACPVLIPAEEAARRYRAGETLAVLGKSLGASPSRLADALRAAGVDVRRPGQKAPHREAVRP